MNPFVCKLCGYIDLQGKEEHQCNLARPKRSFYSDRYHSCSVCPKNKDGTCSALDKQVKEILTDFSEACPEKHWGPIIADCPQCGAQNTNVSGIEKCAECNHTIFEKRNLVNRVPKSQHWQGRVPKGNPNNFVPSVQVNHKFSQSAFHVDHSEDFCWISTQDLIQDTYKFMSQFPHDIDVIVGVSRSGMLPATLCAMNLHLPMFMFRPKINDVIECGSGWRHPARREFSEFRHVLVVDDNNETGNSCRLARREIPKYFSNETEIKYATVYLNKRSRIEPDFYYKHVQWPMMMEWNIFNSIFSDRLALDFDGILCEDCSPRNDDDGKRYLNFIRNAKPKYLPRKIAIPLIVTARIEKYREPTMEWLNKHNLKVKELIMHPAKSLTERNKDDIAAFKAEHYVRFSKKKTCSITPHIFVESNVCQAKRIAEISKLTVLCPSAQKIFDESFRQKRMRGTIKLKKEKIFCIGMPRTGTASICKALDILGYRVKHLPKFLYEVDNYDALADILIASNYRLLDNKYINSKFILTIRDKEEWLSSIKKLKEKEELNSPQLNRARDNLFPKNKTLLDCYQDHINNVNEYFKDRVLKYNVVDGWEPICNFLGYQIPNKPFPHLNNKSYKNVNFRSEE